ncbi:MAG: glutaminyl-peptide cyclotransferase [Pseudomonadales bacterium]|nr:glutaminyl-peptide cyclotransferase [Pseudomonadales bacterium]
MARPDPVLPGSAHVHRLTLPAVALLLTALAALPIDAAEDAPLRYDYTVLNVYPHDPRAFTQGLLYRAGHLYESTGRYGESELRRVSLETGRVVKRRRLGRRYFGEGLTAMDDRLVQLTWRNGVAFVRDAGSLALLERFEYPGEGWGLAHDGRRLIMSDGSAVLRFLNPAGLVELDRVTVRDRGRPLVGLNELEMVDDLLYANVWQTDEIVMIDLASGRVTGRADLSGLLTPAERAETDVLNGIAWDADDRRLFVTGKLWPKLFEISLTPQPGPTRPQQQLGSEQELGSE